MIRLKDIAAADVPIPPAGKTILFLDLATGEPSYKDSAGVTTSLQGSAAVVTLANIAAALGVTAGQLTMLLNLTNLTDIIVTANDVTLVNGPKQLILDLA